MQNQRHAHGVVRPAGELRARGHRFRSAMDGEVLEGPMAGRRLSGLSLDEGRGIVYASTETAGPDFWGLENPPVGPPQA